MLDAFVQELQKLAHPVIEDPKDLEKVLKPGDLLYTQPKKIDGLKYKLFYEISKRVQGDPHTHISIYAGDGAVVDAASWKRRGEESLRIHQVPLKKFMDRYKFRVLRVDAAPSVRREAAEFSKDQVGKTFNTRGMLRLALPFQGRADKEDRQRQDAEKFFCSELVANAYASLGIAKNKKLKHILPGDIAKSRLTKTVAESS